MATSHYFNNFSPASTTEQRILEDIIVESIQIMGHNCYYMPRESYAQMDEIYGEDTLSKFSKAYIIEMYLANVEGYEGDGDFFSKFGLELRDTSNFVVSRRAFQRYVPAGIAARPREGDLIFVPVLNKIFEIKFVEEEMMYFALGKRNPYIYELRCEAFRYSNEDINTGVDEVDIIEDITSYTIELSLGTGSNNFIIGETVYQGSNLAYSTVKADVTDWSPVEKKLKVVNIIGAFNDANTVIGATSNTRYTLTTNDTLGDFVQTDEFDNKKIQTEANTFIDLSEINPFGIP